MKILMSLLMLVLCFGFVGTAHAAKGEKKGLRGKIASLDGKNVVVTARAKGATSDVTVATDDHTSITVDGNKAAIGDLKPGMYVMVSPAEGTAVTITASTTKPERKKKGAADSNSNPTDDKKPAATESK